MTTSSASKSNTSDLLHSSGCLTCSMNVCAPTASLRYGRNRELSVYSSPAKTQQAQTAICHTYKLFERLILNRVAPPPFMDEHLIPEQAGFRPGKSCTNQLLNLTQFIEDGYEEGLITETAFVDISAAYDTMNHRILNRKLFDIIQDVRLTELIQNMLSNRLFLWTSSANAADSADRRMAFHKAASLPL